MVDAFILPIVLLVATAVWTAMAQLARHRRTCRQLEIVSRGVCCEGKVVAIQRPSVVDGCTRLYFDFEPQGADRPLRACHVDRCPLGHSPAALVSIGQVVSVRYLQDRPRDALISNLVSATAAAA